MLLQMALFHLFFIVEKCSIVCVCICIHTHTTSLSVHKALFWSQLYFPHCLAHSCGLWNFISCCTMTLVYPTSMSTLLSIILCILYSSGNQLVAYRQLMICGPKTIQCLLWSLRIILFLLVVNILIAKDKMQTSRILASLIKLKG